MTQPPAVLRYTTLRQRSAGELDIDVNDYLDAGWTLYGSPYAMPPGHDRPGVYCQAMINLDDVTDELEEK